MNAILIAEALPHMPPVSNLYRTNNGHLMVMVVDVPDVAAILSGEGNRVPIARSHLNRTVSVFLADERGQVIDYDGGPANGMTPILSTDSKSFAMTIVPSLINSDNPYADALAALGYTLTEQEPTDG